MMFGTIDYTGVSRREREEREEKRRGGDDAGIRGPYLGKGRKGNNRGRS
jgi:hypothetical protein